MQHVFSAFLSGVRILDSSRVYVFEYLMAVKLVIHGNVAEKQSSSIQEHAHWVEKDSLSFSLLQKTLYKHSSNQHLDIVFMRPHSSFISVVRQFASG